MSRVYLTAAIPHENFGIGLPTFSFETNDHTGGGYDIAGLHPTTIASLFGKGPEIKKGERFDLKFNLNAKRTSLSLVVTTTRHLPHWEWSSDGGAGKLPLVGLGALATQYFKKGQGEGRRAGKGQSLFAPKSPIYTNDGHIRRKTREKKHGAPKTSGARTGRGHSSSTRTHDMSRDGDHYRQRRPRSSSSPRHTPKRSRESSYNPRRDRGSTNKKVGPRKHDRDYDSGYASEEAMSGSQEIRALSRQGNSRKRASDRSDGRSK